MRDFKDKLDKWMRENMQRVMQDKWGPAAVAAFVMLALLFALCSVVVVFGGF